MSFPQQPQLCTAGHRHRPKARVCGVHPTRNCPMFSIVGAGGHKGMVDTLAIHLHTDMRCVASSLVAMVPPSVNGMTSSHHVMSSSPKLSLQASSYIVICHIGSRHVLTGKLLIMICLLVSWKGLFPSESSLSSSDMACGLPMEWEETA